AAAPTRGAGRASAAGPVQPFAVVAHVRDDMRTSLRPERDLEAVPVRTAVLLVMPLRRDPAKWSRAAPVAQQPAQLPVPVAVEILRRRGLEDDRQRVGIPFPQQLWEQLDVVAANQLRGIGAHDVDRTPQSFEPAPLVGPDE